MMGDIGALVVRNDLGLEESKVKELSRLVQKGAISYLAPDREATAFMLYIVGQDIDGIALRTNIPKDVILLTAIRYDWPAKAKEMKASMVEGDLASIKNDIVRMLLVATHKSMQDELSGVLSGQLDAKHSQMIPKNIKALKDLMDMVDSLGEKVAQPAPGSIQVTGGNVQINMTQPENPAGLSKIDRLRGLKEGE